MCLGGHLRIADAPDVSEDPLGLAGEAARISRRLEHPPPVHPAIATTYPAHLAPAPAPHPQRRSVHLGKALDPDHLGANGVLDEAAHVLIVAPLRRGELDRRPAKPLIARCNLSRSAVLLAREDASRPLRRHHGSRPGRRESLLSIR